MSEMDFEDRPELPDEAGDFNAEKFDPDNKWLKKAPRELQIEAMRRWFYARYQDPANDTPYDGREGGYLFIHGGPYDPDDEIQDRFSDIVEYDVMEELIQDLVEQHGDEWAPIDYEEYSDFLQTLSQIETEDEDTPLNTLLIKLQQVEEIVASPLPPNTKAMITQLSHSAAIAALEAYLFDLTVWHALNNEHSLKSFVSKNTDPKLGEKTLKLSEIFTQMDELKKRVFNHLQASVWHRLTEVKNTFENSFGITFPKHNELLGDILLRHDILHRGGKNKDGEVVIVSAEDICKVTKRIREFATSLEAAFENKHNEALE